MESGNRRPSLWAEHLRTYQTTRRICGLQVRVLLFLQWPAWLFLTYGRGILNRLVVHFVAVWMLRFFCNAFSRDRDRDRKRCSRNTVGDLVSLCLVYLRSPVLQFFGLSGLPFGKLSVLDPDPSVNVMRQPRAFQLCFISSGCWMNHVAAMLSSTVHNFNAFHSLGH